MRQPNCLSRTPWLRRNWHWVGALVLLLLALAIPDAAARAGGGGSYRSSGGGSSGGGGGGGGGGGLALYFLLRLVVAYPAVGVPVVIAVVAGLAYAGYFGKQQADVQIQGRGIRRGRGLADTMARELGISQIQEDDPAFSAERFLARVGDAFVRVQNAWSEQNLVPVCHFLSDAVHERFSLQIADQRQRGVRNVMEQVAVLGAAIAQVDVTSQFHTIAVRVEAVAVDYEVDRDGKRLSGGKGAEVFVEYWSFLRRPGTQTKEGSGLLEGNCPNCGAGLQINQGANCEFCGAKVRSGQYDWVLAEITQESEWHPVQPRAIPGVAEIAAHDPGFSLQHVEDRASVMFWRRIAAMQSGKVDPLRMMAREECCAALEEELRPDGRGVRLVPTEAAVGAVDTVAIFVEEPVDRALLEVRWSCGLHELLPDGSRRPHAAASFRCSFFVLSRAHGSSSDVDATLSSAHCPSCGAPAMASAASACEYCGAVLNQGDRDWVLDAVLPRHDPLIAKLFGRLQQEAPARPQGGSPSGGRELAAWMVYMMLADGQIDAKEEQLLHAFAGHHGIGKGELEGLIAAMRASRLEVNLPADAAQARAWLEIMAEMALADGFIADEEQEAMLVLGQRLDLSRYDVTHIIAQTRRRLYQAEKDRVRELRRQT